MKKKQAVLRRKDKPAASSKVTPIASPAQIPQSGFLKLTREIVSNKLFLIIGLVVALSVGIGTQLNWMQLKCPGEPFTGSKIEYCGYNVWRVSLAGPILFFVLLILTSWLHWLSYKSNIKKTTLWYLLLLPLALLPFVKSESVKNSLTTVTVLLFLITGIYLFRDLLRGFLKKIFAAPSFSIDVSASGDTTEISLSGRFEVSERDFVHETMVDFVLNASFETSKIRVNLSQMGKITEDFAFVFSYLIGFAQAKQLDMRFIGFDESLSTVMKTLQQQLNDGVRKSG